MAHFPRVLVLGATGRIGRVLRAHWGAEAALWQTRRPEAGAGWVQFDPLREPDALARAAAEVETILCLSGVTPGRGGDMGDNVTLARAAVQGAAQSGARVLLASSAAVYGNQQGDLDEATPLAPLSDYGRAKQEMEQECALLGSTLGVETTALRIGNIAGLDAILGGWRPGFQLDQFADGRTPERSYIGPISLARVLRDLTALPDLPGVLNIAAPGAVEMGALLDRAGLGWTARAAPDTAIARVALDVSALCALSPVAPQEGRPEALVRQWQQGESA